MLLFCTRGAQHKDFFYSCAPLEIKSKQNLDYLYLSLVMDINVCRLCLEKSTELTSIFTCETSFILTDFIAEFTKVNVCY